MSATSEASVDPVGLPGWIPQLCRAVVALALGVLITLTLEHSAEFGLIVFGVFTVATGAILIGGALGGPDAGRLRRAFLAQGILTVGAGVAALVGTSAGLPYLVILVGGFGLVTGGLELTCGILSRRTHPAARDWVLVGAATVALGVLFLLIPGDLAQQFSGENGAAGTITSAVVLVGVLGAWAIIIGVVEAISAVSLRTQRK